MPWLYETLRPGLLEAEERRRPKRSQADRESSKEGKLGKERAGWRSFSPRCPSCGYGRPRHAATRSGAGASEAMQSGKGGVLAAHGSGGAAGRALGVCGLPPRSCAAFAFAALRSESRVGEAKRLGERGAAPRVEAKPARGGSGGWVGGATDARPAGGEWIVGEGVTGKRRSFVVLQFSFRAKRRSVV